jgi:DNA-directed RNA polymerase subunit RPC12/RpoP
MTDKETEEIIKDYGNTIRETIRDFGNDVALIYSKGITFPTKRTVHIYKCERCGNEWERLSTDRSDNGRCPLAKCDGSLITKFIRFLKGEKIHSYGKLIKEREDIHY